MNRLLIPLVLVLGALAFLLMTSGPKSPEAADVAERETEVADTDTETLDNPAEVEEAGESSGGAREVADHEAGGGTAEDLADSESEAEQSFAIVLARLVNDAGQGIEGGTLALQRQDTEAKSDAEGHVRLEVPSEQVSYWRGTAYAMTLYANAEGHATHALRATLARNGTTDLGELILDPGCTVSGRVVNEQGHPVPNVPVKRGPAALESTEEEARYKGPAEGEMDLPSVTTDEEGRYQLAGLPLGSARLWAKAPTGIWTFTGIVELSRDVTFEDLVLEPTPEGSMVEGLVLDPVGNPVPGARVFYSDHGWTPNGASQVRTDNQGRFQFSGAPHELYLVKAFDKDSEYRSAFITDAKPGGKVVELRLGEFIPFVIHVKDAETGEPIAAPWTSLNQNEAYMWAPDMPDERKHPEVGTVVYPLPEGSFNLSVSANGYTDESLGPLDESTVSNPLVVELKRETMVTGVVYADDKPLKGAWVMLGQVMGDDFTPTTQGFRTRIFDSGGHTTTTNEKGEFEVNMPKLWGPATGVALVAAADGWAATEQVIEPDENGAHGIKLVLTRGGSIEGQVLVAAGDSTHGKVVAASRGDGRILEARVDSEGQYRFDHMAAGPWEVRVQDQSEEMVISIMDASELGPFTGDCEVIEGQTTRHDLDERGKLRQLDGQLSFNGEPASGWTVQHKEPNSWGFEAAGEPVMLGPGGNFSFETTKETAQLVFTGVIDGGTIRMTRSFDLKDGVPDLNWDLSAGSVEGTASSEGRVRLTADLFGFATYVEVDTDASGRFTVSPMLVGRHAAESSTEDSPGWSGATMVDVAEGATAQVSL